MRGITCRQAERWSDERAIGCELTEGQTARLEAHLQQCSACAERMALGEGLRRAAIDEPLEALPQLVERRMLAGRGPVRTGIQRRGRRMRALALRSAVAGAALATVVLTFLWFGARDRGTDTGAGPAPVAENRPPLPAGEVAVPRQVEAAPDEWRAVACASEDTTLWLDPGSAVEVAHNDGREARFVFDGGRVVAEIGANQPGFRFVVTTPHLEVVARGTVFVVEFDAEEREIVRVLEGTVEVLDAAAGGEGVSLIAGQQLRRGDGRPETLVPGTLGLDLAEAGAARAAAALQELLPSLEAPPVLAESTAGDALAARGPTPERNDDSDEPDPPVAVGVAPGDDDDALAIAAPTAVTPTIEELTRLAQSHQRARQYDQACATYRQLIDAYPDSPAARNTLVALGQIEFGATGNPEQALEHFDAYLADVPQGVLAGEARLGRVRVLTALSRQDEVVEAAGAFIAYHPENRAHPEVLRLRGDAHRLAGRPQEAAGDYTEVLARWPDSPQGALARSALAEIDPSP